MTGPFPPRLLSRLQPNPGSLDEELDQQLSKLALSTGRSESAIIREALGTYLAREAEKGRQRGNPLARLLELQFHSETTDGSEKHDRDLYARGPASPGEDRAR